jgi:hypothetical protein
VAYRVLFRKSLLFLLSLITFLLSFSCATAPKTGGPGSEFDYLARGATAYFYADVGRAMPILSNISLNNIDMAQTGTMLKSIDFLAGAAYPPGAPRRLMLHAWRKKGSIPGGVSLALSPLWKKADSQTGKPYYRSADFGLSVSIQGGHAFVSTADPFTDDPPVGVPRHLGELGFQALVFGWLDNAAAPINNFLAATGMPVSVPAERILFAIHEAPPTGPSATGPLYELRLRVETLSPNQAGAVVTLLNVVRAAVERLDVNAAPEVLEALRLLLANPPVQDGPDLALRTSPLAAERIALLLNRFAVYSQQKEE